MWSINEQEKGVFSGVLWFFKNNMKEEDVIINEDVLNYDWKDIDLIWK